ncbi:hypothetical protein R80B4_01329 [Fibrobacteres bacterium R8-0-B4]
MATVQTTPIPVISDDIFKEVDKFKKRGNWTEERHEVLKDLTWAEIEADAMRRQAEHPERYSTPEEINERIKRIEEALAAERRVEMADA